MKPYIDHIYRPLGTVLFQPGKMATLPREASLPGNHNISHPSFHCCTHGFSLHLNHYTDRLARAYHRERTELTSNTSAVCQSFVCDNILSEHVIAALDRENDDTRGRSTRSSSTSSISTGSCSTSSTTSSTSIISTANTRRNSGITSGSGSDWSSRGTLVNHPLTSTGSDSDRSSRETLVNLPLTPTYPKPTAYLLAISLNSLIIQHEECLPSIPVLFGMNLAVSVCEVQQRLIQHGLDSKHVSVRLARLGDKRLRKFLRLNGQVMSRTDDVLAVLAGFQQRRLTELQRCVPSLSSPLSLPIATPQDPTDLVLGLFAQVRAGHIRTQLRQLYLILLAYFFVPEHTLDKLATELNLTPRYFNAALSFLYRLLSLTPVDMEACISLLSARFRLEIPCAKFAFLAKTLENDTWKDELTAAGPLVQTCLLLVISLINLCDSV